MEDREPTIRALCALAKLDELADDIVASEMTVDDTSRLLTTVTALLDQAIDSAPSMPNMDMLSGGWVPSSILEKVRTLIAIAVGDSRMPPRGLQ